MPFVALVYSILFFVLFSAHQANAIPNEHFTVDWSCEQSDHQKRSLPQTAKLRVSANRNSDGLTIVEDQFQEFVAKAKKSPEDYSVCISDTYYRWRDALFSTCENEKFHARECYSKAIATANYVSRQSFDYAGAPLIIPGESNKLPTTKMLEDSKAHCSISISMMSKEFLENGFTQHLNQLDSKCRFAALRGAHYNLAEFERNNCSENQSSPSCDRVKKALPIAMGHMWAAMGQPKTPNCLSGKSLADQIELFRDDIQDELRCIPNKIKGPPVIKDTSSMISGSGYAISQVEKDKYIIDVKIDLAPIINQPDNNVDSSKLSLMWKEIDRCFNEVNSKLIGPNGERIKIRINNKQAPKELKTHKVVISELNSRANMAEWRPNLKCPVITHEMMHWLGLVDDYHEQSSGFLVEKKTGKAQINPGTNSIIQYDSEPEKIPAGYEYKLAYDCRSIAPIDSLMNNQDEAFFATFGKRKVQLCICASCDLKNMTPENFESKCRDGFKQTYFISKIDPIPEASDVKWVHIIDESPPTRKSLLYPAQFRQLLQPNCKKLVGPLVHCADNAYYSSYKFPNNKCPDVPKDCEDPKKWLLK